MKTNVICNKCGELNTVDINNIKKTETMDESGQKYYITYCICKRCKEVIILQIDDIFTKTMLSEQYNILRMVINDDKINKAEKKKLRKEYERINKGIIEKRNELSEYCQGKKLTFYINKNEKIVVKCLTSKGKDDIIDSVL